MNKKMVEKKINNAINVELYLEIKNNIFKECDIKGFNKEDQSPVKKFYFKKPLLIGGSFVLALGLIISLFAVGNISINNSKPNGSGDHNNSGQAGNEFFGEYTFNSFNAFNSYYSFVKNR